MFFIDLMGILLQFAKNHLQSKAYDEIPWHTIKFLQLSEFQRQYFEIYLEDLKFSKY